MAGLLEDYPMPSVDISPQDQERLRALALMRLGFGMAGGQNIGQAMQGGINTLFAGQEEARRSALARAQLAMEQQKYAAAARKQAALQEAADRLDPNQLLAAGISQDEIRYGKANPEYLPELFKRLEPKKMGPGDLYYVPGVGFLDQAPDKDGMVTVFDQMGRAVGRRQLSGQTEAMARQAGAIKAAEQAQTFMQLGVDEQNRPQYGFPVPPAMRQQVPVQTNFSGTPQEQAAARQAMTQDLARMGMAPKEGMDVVSRGMSPVAEAEKKAYGEKSVADWFTLGKDTIEAGGLAGQMRAKIGVMRDVLQQPNRPQGALGPFYVAAQQFGASLGIPTEGLSSSELFKSMTTQIALTVRNPAGDMGLPGSASNQDFTRLIEVAPNLSQSEKGQKLLVEAYDAISQMALKKSEKWAELNDRIDRGEIRPAAARKEFTESITPLAMDATRAIRAAIKESPNAAPAATGATAAPTTQRAVELNKLSQRERELQDWLKRNSRGQ